MEAGDLEAGDLVSRIQQALEAGDLENVYCLPETENPDDARD